MQSVMLAPNTKKGFVGFQPKTPFPAYSNSNAGTYHITALQL